MSGDNKNILKIASVYIGTVLGAGFASGKELLSFFVDYGIKGFLGIVISGIIFAFVGFFVLEISRTKKIYEYSDFSTAVFGKRLGKIMEIFAVVFMLVLFATMIAGGGTLVCEAFEIIKIKAEILIAAVCFLIFLFDVDGLVKINVVLCPILVIGGVFIGIYSFLTSATDVFMSSDIVFKYFDNFFNSSLLYVSYNIITAVSVLVSLAEAVKTKQTSFKSGMFVGVAMAFLGICMAMPVFLKYDSVFLEEIPMLKIVSEYFVVRYLYILILLCAVITTAVSNGFAVINAVCSAVGVKSRKEEKRKHFFVSAAVVLWALILAQIGFSNFVAKVYPLFGYIGLFQIAVIVVVYFRITFKEKI